MAGMQSEKDFYEKDFNEKDFNEKDFNEKDFNEKDFIRGNFRIGKSYREVRAGIAEQGPQNGPPGKERLTGMTIPTPKQGSAEG